MNNKMMTTCLGGLRVLVKIMKSEQYPESEPDELLVCVIRGKSIIIFLCLIFPIRIIMLVFSHRFIIVNRKVIKKYSSLCNIDFRK